MKRALPKGRLASALTLFCLLSVRSSFAQTDLLSLSSGTASANGAVTLNLNLMSSAGQPAAFNGRSHFLRRTSLPFRPPPGPHTNQRRQNPDLHEQRRIVHLRSLRFEFHNDCEWCSGDGQPDACRRRGFYFHRRCQRHRCIDQWYSNRPIFYRRHREPVPVEARLQGSLLSHARREFFPAEGVPACIVTLSKAATAAITVTLSDNNALLTTPASVTVAAGATTAGFTLSAGERSPAINPP